MITIESLVDMGANVKLEVTPTDLKMFAESIIQRTIMAQQEEQKAIMEVSLQKTGKTLPFFLSYEEEKQGVTKREAVSPAVYMRAVFVLY